MTFIPADSQTDNTSDSAIRKVRYHECKEAVEELGGRKNKFLTFSLDPSEKRK
jgi:hypothetical protein